MPRKLAGMSLALLMTLSAALWAESPRITGVAPFGLQRGVPTEVTIQGAALKGNPRLIAPGGLKVEDGSVVDADAANLKVKLTAPIDTPPGVYPIRIRTDDGLSNPFLIAVGQVPEIAEKEDNNSFETAQAVPVLCAVQGQASGNDVDFFKITGEKGRTIVVDAQCARIGSGLDPQIRLTTAGRKFVASADDSPGLLTDARIVATLPEDGEYLIEISDSKYQGTNRPVYRLLIGAIPIAEETFPSGGRRGQGVVVQLRGGTLTDPVTRAVQLAVAEGVDSLSPRFPAVTDGSADPTVPADIEPVAPLAVGDLPEAIAGDELPAGTPPPRLTPPILINGRLARPAEVDRHTIAVVPGKKYRATLIAAELGSGLDAQVQIIGAKDAVIATGDDSPLPVYPTARKKANPAQKKADFVSPDASVEFTAPKDLSEITAVVRDLEGRGGVGFTYRLAITPVVPGFDLWLDESEANIPKGGSTNVYVTAQRAGYNGPIALAIPDPPAGLTVRSTDIPEGQTLGILTLAASADAAFDTADLRVIGQSRGSDTPIVRTARKAVVFAQQGLLPSNLALQSSLPVATAADSPIAIDLPAGPVEVAHGTEVSLTVKARRSAGNDAGVAITALTALPKGVSLVESKVAEKADEGKAAFKADAEAPLGPQVIGLEAKAKVGGKDRTFDVPVVVVQIVRPVGVRPSTTVLAVKPGETATLVGTVARKAGFDQPITIKLDGLPKGLSCEPITLDKDKAEFALSLVAAADAPEAKADAKLLPAFQINKKDYATPPVPVSIEVKK